MIKADYCKSDDEGSVLALENIGWERELNTNAALEAALLKSNGKNQHSNFPPQTHMLMFSNYNVYHLIVLACLRCIKCTKQRTPAKGDGQWDFLS